MNNPAHLFYEFGEFRWDADKHRLWRGDEVVALTPKAVETLTVLIEHRGRLVERDQLMNSVWPDVAVEDGNLTVTVSMLRKALGEDGKDRKFIETVPRLGYKFVADVREIVEDTPALIIEKRTTGRIIIDQELRLGGGHAARFWSAVATHRRLVISAAVAIVLTGVLTGAIFTYFRWWRSTPVSAGALNINSVAVLPFKTIDSRNSSSHQGLGLADVLITRLSNVNRIKVRPTSAVIRFENSPEDSITIGRAINVDAVLEGTIYYAADKVRITGRLIRISDQLIIWSGQFERLQKDELQLQNEIALQVTNALALNLSANEKVALSKPYTENADAYQLYVNGRFEWNKRNFAGLLEAQRLFRNAIEKDPSFALAYVGLADSLMFNDNATEARSVLGKALELDPNLGEAHATAGFSLTVHGWSWNEAESEFKKAIDLNPGYPTAHHWYATLLGIQGRNEEAKAELQRALEIDPNSYNFLADLGQVYYFNHEYDKAKEYYNQALAVYPDFTFAHNYLYAVYLQTGEYEAAIEENIQAEMIMARLNHPPAGAEKQNSDSLNLRRERYRRLGIRRLLAEDLERAQKATPLRDPSLPYGFALILAFLGEKEKALDNLEQALENRAFMMAWIKAEPRFDSLRPDPRFQAILKRMKLA